MYLEVYDIIPGLAPYIKLICSMDCSGEADTSSIRVLPDACLELFVNYTESPIAIIGDELHLRSIITSRMSRPMDVRMRKGAGCFAVCFHPGMAYDFFRVPMHTLTDTTVALSDIWSSAAAEIEDRLAGACDNQARASVLQNYLLQKLAAGKPDPHIAYCLKQAQLSRGLIPVSDLTDAVGLSQRHLSRKFRQHTGLSPKAYLRVSRFIRSLDHLKKHPILSLTEIAYESGYYDQSHFNRDYQAYSGHTPGELVNAKHILY